MNIEDIDFNHPVFAKASTISEIASFIGADDKFISREIAKGNLRARKFNRRMLRILPFDLVSWLKRAETA